MEIFEKFIEALISKIEEEQIEGLDYCINRSGKITDVAKQEYTKPKVKYIVTHKNYMLVLKYEPSQVMECLDVDQCIVRPNNCQDCPFSNRNGGVNLNDCKIHKIEY